MNKIMKRPMFKMGGPTSGGTGITSGLETPRQNFAYSTYGEAVQAIPKAFEKTRTGLQNQQSALGPLAVYQALSGGALEGVEDFGDLAMAFGDPAVLQAVGSGMVSKNKLDTQIDALDLNKSEDELKTILGEDLYSKVKEDIKPFIGKKGLEAKKAVIRFIASHIQRFLMAVKTDANTSSSS